MIDIKIDAERFPAGSGCAGADENDIFSLIFKVCKLPCQRIYFMIVKALRLFMQERGGTDFDPPLF